MRNRQRIIGLFIVAALALLIVGITQAQTPGGDTPSLTLGGSPTETFTYQGYLEEGGKPANGAYDFSFHLYNTSSEGTLISDCQTFENYAVTDGMFAFNLVPAAGMTTVFNGEERWIEIRVKPHAAATYTTLPRQPITAVPYAWGLRPGAIVRGYQSAATLELRNTYTETQGWALRAYNQSGAPTFFAQNLGSGSALFARAVDTAPVLDIWNESSGLAVSAQSHGHALLGRTYTTQTVGVMGTQVDHNLTDFTSSISNWWLPGGFFAGRNGVVGMTKTARGIGVLGYNQAPANGWAGLFTADNGNGVQISTPDGTIGLVVQGGAKSAAVSTDAGDRLLYTEESTEVWFTDYGFGQLNDGQAVIAIEPLFAQTVNLAEPYHVFVQAYGDAEIYVTGRTMTQFEVHLRAGDDTVEFSYRIVAKRANYEHIRLAPLSGQTMQQAAPTGDLP
jgi:hypothetical protein